MTQSNFTAEEAAAYLRLSKTEFERCTHTTDPHDYIPCARVGASGRKRIFRIADLEAWLDRHMEP